VSPDGSRDPRAVLRSAGLRPKKSFGQNFLVAEPIARAIATACVPDAEVGRARVVEIGAGTGALTRLLAERARSVVAVERDRDLVPLLERDLAGPSVRVVEADAQSTDLAALLGDADAGSPRVLCGNLPYAITGPLLRRAVELAASVERVVFMLQGEVGDRLTAAPGTKAWGALTVFVRAAFDVRRVLRAGPGAFHPPPEVTSVVVELSPLRPPRARETARFRALVRGAFEARRKTLRNAWSRVAPDAAALERAAARAGVALDARGETLDVDAFARMAEALDAEASPSE
jgi:16S rRNA (adenine1518-N6/adenine1519-N6)-dimethyltransferase